MNYNCGDNIAALSTAPGKSALALIRVSGNNLDALFLKVTKNIKPIPNHAFVTNLLDASNPSVVLDRVVLTFFKKPKSFTGEDCLEISCHGGNVVSRSILNMLYSSGLREAAPGEFSYRAFLNGKIDLLQAESIVSLVSSNSKFDAGLGLNGVSGKNTRLLRNVQSSIKNVLSYIENELDFSEDDILDAKNSIKGDLVGVCENLSSILNSSVMCSKLKDGLRVVLVGPPNSGKSSLFNCLLGEDRVIVSGVPGTTRDTIESWHEIKGVSVCFVDTAGLWETKDFLEKRGIEKTNQEVFRADILLILDEHDPVAVFKTISDKVKHKSVILINSKCDDGVLKNKTSDVLPISSKNNIGIDDLLYNISNIVSSMMASLPNNYFFTTTRQRLIIENVLDDLEKLIQSSLSLNLDIISSLLWGVVKNFDNLFESIDSNDIINNIFSKFCVGK